MKRLLLLCALVLLYVSGENFFFLPPNEDYCYYWLYGKRPYAKDFECDEWRDGTEVKICCGTCSPPCCCSSEGSLQEHHWCPPAGNPSAPANTVEKCTSPFSNIMQYWMIFLSVSCGIILAFVVNLCLYVQFKHCQARKKIRKLLEERQRESALNRHRRRRRRRRRVSDYDNIAPDDNNVVPNYGVLKDAVERGAVGGDAVRRKVTFKDANREEGAVDRKAVEEGAVGGKVVHYDVVQRKVTFKDANREEGAGGGKAGEEGAGAGKVGEEGVGGGDDGAVRGKVAHYDPVSKEVTFKDADYFNEDVVSSDSVDSSYSGDAVCDAVYLEDAAFEDAFCEDYFPHDAIRHTNRLRRQQRVFNAPNSDDDFFDDVFLQDDIQCDTFFDDYFTHGTVRPKSPLCRQPNDTPGTPDAVRNEAVPGKSASPSGTGVSQDIQPAPPHLSGPAVHFHRSPTDAMVTVWPSATEKVPAFKRTVPRQYN